MIRALPLSSLPDDTIAEALGHLAENLRPADLAELQASVTGRPLEVLEQSVALSSHAWLVVDATGLPVAAFGVAPGVLEGIGVPWLMATPAVEREFVSFARQTRRYVEEVQEIYPTLTNFVDVRNDLAVTWLSWAGFQFIDADPRYGVEERPFLQFAKTRPLCATR